ncbi:hypothetical protein NWF32_25280 [Pseudomonas qingdaonensis]|nr:hypothetical protein [Pseudomonas qingdaonensis]
MSNGELFDSGEIEKLDAGKVLAHMNSLIVLKRWEEPLPKCLPGRDQVARNAT